VAKKIEGVEDAHVSFALSTLEMNLREGQDAKSIVRSLRRKGYDAIPIDAHLPVGLKAVRGAVSGRRVILTTICGGFLVAALVTYLVD
jgi:hypothetical protein